MGKTMNCCRCDKDITATKDKHWVSEVPKNWVIDDDDGNAVLCAECAAKYEELALADLAKRNGEQLN